MKKAPNILAFGAIAVSLVFALGAGSNPIETAIEKETGAKVDTDKDGNVTVKTKDGEAEFGAGASLPKTFPKELPVPKGGKLVSATTVADGWGLQYQGISKSSFDDLVGKVEAAGGTSTYESQSAEMVSSMFELDGYSVQLLLISGDDPKDSVLSYTVGKIK